MIIWLAAVPGRIAPRIPHQPTWEVWQRVHEQLGGLSGARTDAPGSPGGEQAPDALATGARHGCRSSVLCAWLPSAALGVAPLCVPPSSQQFLSGLVGPDCCFIWRCGSLEAGKRLAAPHACDPPAPISTSDPASPRPCPMEKPHPAHKCQHYVERKKRWCRFDALPGTRYCGGWASAAAGVACAQLASGWDSRPAAALGWPPAMSVPLQALRREPLRVR